MPRRAQPPASRDRHPDGAREMTASAPDFVLEQHLFFWFTQLLDRRDRQLAAATQAQALAALQFLYRHVVDRPLVGLGGVPRARAPVRLPVVLNETEVAAVLRELHGVPRLVGMLLYGGGMRLLECLTLRIKDVDLERREIRAVHWADESVWSERVAPYNARLLRSIGSTGSTGSGALDHSRDPGALYLEDGTRALDTPPRA